MYTIFATEFILWFTPKYLYIFYGIYGDILAECSSVIRANFRQLSRTSADKIWRSTVLTSGIKQVYICVYDYGFSRYPRTRDSAFALCIYIRNKAHIIIIYSRWPFGLKITTRRRPRVWPPPTESGWDSQDSFYVPYVFFLPNVYVGILYYYYISGVYNINMYYGTI